MENEIVGNNDFKTSTFATGKKYKGTYLKDFFVEPIFQESSFIIEPFPRIVTLQTRIQHLEEEEEEEEEFARQGF